MALPAPTKPTNQKKGNSLQSRGITPKNLKHRHHGTKIDSTKISVSYRETYQS
jgi:hypothetical protein